MNKEGTVNKKHLVWILYFALIAGVIGGSFVAGKAIARPSVASAQEILGSNAPEAPDAVFRCPQIVSVGTFYDRIHLECGTANPVATGPGTTTDVYYYAYANDPAHATVANELLALGNTAYALGKGADLFYNSSSSDNPSGCGTGDCRGLTGATIHP
jgi:hypothetical protein